MKTKEQVLEHLANNGYVPYASEKVMGFLLGNGIIKKGEKVKFLLGSRSFDDFYNWFTGKDKINMELKNLTIRVTKDGKSFILVCLTDLVNGKVVGFNGNKIKVYELCVGEIEFATDEEIGEFMQSMINRGFCFMPSLGFLLTDEINYDLFINLLGECDCESCKGCTRRCPFKEKEDR